MHAIIYGTGKWARLLGSKLKDHSLFPIHIGSDDTVALFSRGNRPKILQRLPVFIASRTKNHFDDFKDCLHHNPTAIYIEKGFSSLSEREEAKKLAVEIPVYFLSQYRFSSVLDKFLKLNESILGIRYVWNIEQHPAQEWLFHILSIDNYIKETKNNIYITDYGNYDIDSISKVQIKQSFERSCKIEIETTTFGYTIELGKSNKLYQGNLVIESVVNEDCLGIQLSNIMNDKKEKLERL